MTNKVQNIKRRLMFTSLIFSILLMSFFIYMGSINYENRLEKEAIDFQDSIKGSYAYEIKLLETFYNTRIKCNIGDKKLLEYFENEDSKNLYSVVKDKYSALVKENKYLKVMHFASKENITILRGHNPKKFGDDLGTFRPIVKSTNKFLKEHYGLEAGKHGLFYRIINPVFTKEKKHIGSLEFGIELDYLVDRLKNYNRLNQYAFLIEQEQLKNYKKKDETLIWNNMFLLSDHDNFFRHLHKKIDLNKDFNVVKKENKFYLVVKSVEISNYLKEPIGVMISALDITKLNESYIQQRNQTIVFGVILLVAALVMLNFGFNRYIRQLSNITKSLENKVVEIQKDNELLEKYTISSKTDLKGRIIHVSDAFCQISGYTRDELIGKNHNIVRHKDMPSSLYKELWSLIKVGQYWEGEIKNQKKDGSHYWVKAYITPEFDKKGNIVGFSAVRKDITLEKDLELKA